MTCRPLIGLSGARGNIFDSSMTVRSHWASELVIESVTDHGGVPIVLPVTGNPDGAARAIGAVSALILTGGNDVSRLGAPHRSAAIDPQHDDNDLLLVGAARARSIPLLGICRGMQLLVASAGGTLQPVTGHAETFGVPGHHTLTLSPSSRLVDTIGTETLTVNTLHHYAVKQVGEHQATAWAADGIIEAVEHPHRWELGVQWHPELGRDATSDLLWAEFIDQARRVCVSDGLAVA